jgi:regulator of replication initiation timing
MRLKTAISWTVLAALIAGIFFTVNNAQNIMDWFKLQGYEPPARIAKLADETTMKPDTRRIFYVNHPQISQKAEFQKQCESKEKSIVLGCYVNPGGIYLLDVTDPRLSGVVEVTAAHEVLHAVYDRLDSDERERVDKLTNNFLKTIKDDRILKTVENYRKKDPGVVPSELHSIFGTEVADLPQELEDYYALHFSNRKKIVAFSQQYEQTFIELEERVESLDRQLESIKRQLDNNNAELSRREVEIDQKRRELDRLLQNNEVEQYNSQVAVFNQMVSSYNSLINSSRQLANKYNQIVEERNSLVTTEQQLREELDSNIIPEKKTQ